MHGETDGIISMGDGNASDLFDGLPSVFALSFFRKTYHHHLPTYAATCCCANLKVKSWPAPMGWTAGAKTGWTRHKGNLLILFFMTENDSSSARSAGRRMVQFCRAFVKWDVHLKCPPEQRDDFSSNSGLDHLSRDGPWKIRGCFIGAGRSPDLNGAADKEPALQVRDHHQTRF